MIGPFRLVVRTSLFQGGDTGSIPVGDRVTFDIKFLKITCYSFNRKIHRFFQILIKNDKKTRKNERKKFL